MTRAMFVAARISAMVCVASVCMAIGSQQLTAQSANDVRLANISGDWMYAADKSKGAPAWGPEVIIRVNDATINVHRVGDGWQDDATYNADGTPRTNQIKQDGIAISTESSVKLAAGKIIITTNATTARGRMTITRVVTVPNADSLIVETTSTDTTIAKARTVYVRRRS